MRQPSPKCNSACAGGCCASSCAAACWRAMAHWEHDGGFSVDASVRIEAADRAGREQLLRYCARPPFAMERLRASTAELAHRRTARSAWALLLARIYEVFPLVCPTCGGAMRILAFITDAPTVRAILAHLGEPTAPPPI